MNHNHKHEDHPCNSSACDCVCVAGLIKNLCLMRFLTGSVSNIQEVCRVAFVQEEIKVAR